ncbi:unnamed protein product, partial [Prorocentrum cordatum]
RLEAKEEEEDAEERRSRRKRGLRGPLAKARRRPATLGLCYQPWPLADLCAARARASARGGTGAWRASGDRTRGATGAGHRSKKTRPEQQGGRCRPGRGGALGSPAARARGGAPPGGGPRGARKTRTPGLSARRLEKLPERRNNSVGRWGSVGCSRTPPHPRQKTAHTDRENVLGSARLWSATRESGPGQEWPCQLARGAPPQRRRPGVRGGDLPVRSARTSKMFMLAQSFAADSGGAVGGCGRRAARGGGGSRSSRHLL